MSEQAHERDIPAGDDLFIPGYPDLEAPKSNGNPPYHNVGGVADWDRGPWHHARNDGSFGFIEKYNLEADAVIGGEYVLPRDEYISERLPLKYDLAFNPDDPAFKAVTDKDVISKILAHGDTKHSQPEQYDIQRPDPMAPQEQAQQGEQS